MTKIIKLNLLVGKDNNSELKMAYIVKMQYYAEDTKIPYLDIYYYVDVYYSQKDQFA